MKLCTEFDHFFHPFSGKRGAPINLIANCFEVSETPDWLLYQYHVSFAPEVESKKVRQGIVNSIDVIRVCTARLFMGDSELYMLHKLEEQVGLLCIFRQGFKVQV